MLIIGLTGGIGMGKSTAARVFRRSGFPVFDADAAVRRLQGPGGTALPLIEAQFPGVVKEARLDRAALRDAVLQDPQALRRLEAIIHPLVRAEERHFLQAARRRRARAAVLDIPLLLEGPPRRELDQIIVVSAPRTVQIARVLRRGSMTRAQIEAVIARQMPDALKRRRADLVVHTGLSRYHAWKALRRCVLGLLEPVAGT